MVAFINVSANSSGCVSSLKAANGFVFSIKIIRMVTFQLCLTMYSSDYVSNLKATNALVFSIDQSNEMETKRRVAEDLSPHHHRLRCSKLSALHQSEHYMYCQRYPV
jgi:hypothetical protein